MLARLCHNSALKLIRCSTLYLGIKGIKDSFVVREYQSPWLNSHVGAYVVSNLAQFEILKFHLSFNKAHNFQGVKCGPPLLFLCAVWKFHKNPIKPIFICATSFNSLTDVSKWLCYFFKAMFPTVNVLWVFKLKKTDVPCDSSWILNYST